MEVRGALGWQGCGQAAGAQAEQSQEPGAGLGWASGSGIPSGKPISPSWCLMSFSLIRNQSKQSRVNTQSGFQRPG